MDSKTINVVDLLPYPTTQVRRFSLIDKGYSIRKMFTTRFRLDITDISTRTVYYNEEIILPCSPKWKEWLQFKKDYPDMVKTLYEVTRTC